MKRNRFPVVELLESRTLLSSVAYSLTTDRAVYQAGQPILITFTETNTGKQPVTVPVSPADFVVSQGSNTLWQSNPGGGSKPREETLNPGQSMHQTAIWAGKTPLGFNLNGGAGRSTALVHSAFRTATGRKGSRHGSGYRTRLPRPSRPITRSISLVNRCR